MSSMGICNRHFNNRFYSYKLCTKLFETTTGFTIDEEHLKQVRIWNTIKQLSIKEDFGRADDKARRYGLLR